MCVYIVQITTAPGLQVRKRGQQAQEQTDAVTHTRTQDSHLQSYAGTSAASMWQWSLSRRQLTPPRHASRRLPHLPNLQACPRCSSESNSLGCRDPAAQHCYCREPRRPPLPRRLGAACSHWRGAPKHMLTSLNQYPHRSQAHPGISLRYNV